MKAVKPVTLEGRIVRMEPLRPGHVEALSAVGLDQELWRWTLSRVATVDDMRTYVEAALSAAAAGTAVPFAIVERASGRPVGSTRYLSIDTEHERLEIGYSWVATPWQRAGVNTDAKLLLLEHAFERLGCRRVEFKTDALNERSRAALRGIGAVEEGTLRQHMVTQGGRRRDSVYFSILESEWPAVRERLSERLRRGGAPASDAVSGS